MNMGFVRDVEGNLNNRQFIALKLILRREQERVLARHGLSLKKFIDAEEEINKEIPLDFYQVIGDYEVKVEQTPTYLWHVIEQRESSQICERQEMGFTKRVTIHKTGGKNGKH